MKVEDILRAKEARIVAVRSGSTVEEAMGLMKAEAVSALVVKDVCRTEGNAFAGMLSDADIKAAVTARGPAALRLPVFQFMARAPITCGPEDSVEEVRELMARHGLCHLPVLDGGTLIGVISDSDLTKATVGVGVGVVAAASAVAVQATAHAR